MVKECLFEADPCTAIGLLGGPAPHIFMSSPPSAHRFATAGRRNCLQRSGKGGELKRHVHARSGQVPVTDDRCERLRLFLDVGTGNAPAARLHGFVARDPPDSGIDLLDVVRAAAGP